MVDKRFLSARIDIQVAARLRIKSHPLLARAHHRFACSKIGAGRLARRSAQQCARAIRCLLYTSPVTDKHNISRAKLAYLSDATAAPVCIIAPISSWAAAVSGFVKDYDGLALFIAAIPYNFYAILTITMMVALALMKFDFGPMKVHEKNAIEKGDLYTTPDRPYANAKEEVLEGKGKVLDLVLPIIVLIISCIIGMIYSGGFFDAEGLSLIHI